MKKPILNVLGVAALTITLFSFTTHKNTTGKTGEGESVFVPANMPFVADGVDLTSSEDKHYVLCPGDGTKCEGSIKIGASSISYSSFKGQGRKNLELQ